MRDPLLSSGLSAEHSKIEYADEDEPEEKACWSRYFR